MAKERRDVYDYYREGQFLFRIGHVHLMEADRPMSLHDHGAMAEYVYLERGSQTYCISGKNYTVNQGEVFFTRPNEPHDTGASLTEVSSLYYFIIDFTCISRLNLFVSAEEAAHIIDAVQHRENRIFKASSGLPNALKQLLDCFSVQGLHFHTKIRNSLSDVLIALTTPDTAENPYLPASLNKSLTYIEEHLTEAIHVAELPLLENMSLSSYHKKFVQLKGLSPAEYILKMKIERAKELLASTDMSVTDIAYKYGFSSSQYFATVFKRFCYLTPTEFRKLARNAGPGRVCPSPQGGISRAIP